MLEPLTVVEIFLRRLTDCPDEPFLVDLSGASLTYRDVASIASDLRTKFDADGAQPGRTLGVYMLNQPQWVVASLAAWSCGLTVAAVNRLMPSDAAAKLLSMSDAARVCVAAGDPLEDDLGVPAVAVPSASMPQIGSPGPMVVPSADTVAAILFTSGTTGEPKAFSFTHEHLVNGARSQAANYAKDAGVRESVAPSHVAPIVSFTAYGHLAVYASMAFSLWTGRRLVLVPKFTVEAVQTLLQHYELSALRLNPAALYMLATTPLEIDMSKVRYVYSGTAPLSQKTRDLFMDRYRVPILQGYGQSETGPVALSRYNDVVSGQEPAGSVGRVIETIEVRIAGEQDRPLPNGSEGEIQVKTGQVARPAIGSSLSVTDDGFVRTGDVGKLSDDGYLWVTGRLQEKMVVGGFNVFPAEIEEVLRRCDGIDDVVVVGLPDDRLGERPVAGVVWSAQPDYEVLDNFARQYLASYKVPRAWFDLEAVPLTDRGKVDRRASLALAMACVGEG